MVDTTKSILVFVYGTLRVGEPYHHLMSACEHLGQRKTQPKYELVNIGRYPGLVANGRTSIVGDLFMVPPEALETLDEYEGYPEDYSRESIDLEGSETATAYFYRLNIEKCPRIPSGDWKKR